MDTNLCNGLKQCSNYQLKKKKTTSLTRFEKKYCFSDYQICDEKLYKGLRKCINTRLSSVLFLKSSAPAFWFNHLKKKKAQPKTHLYQHYGKNKYVCRKLFVHQHHCASPQNCSICIQTSFRLIYSFKAK